MLTKGCVLLADNGQRPIQGEPPVTAWCRLGLQYTRQLIPEANPLSVCILQQQKLAQYETRKVNYNLTWKTDLTHAVLNDPLCKPCIGTPFSSCLNVSVGDLGSGPLNL